MDKRLTYNYKEEYCRINAERWNRPIEWEREHFSKGNPIYLPNHNVTKKEMWNKLGSYEELEEKLNISFDDLAFLFIQLFPMLVFSYDIKSKDECAAVIAIKGFGGIMTVIYSTNDFNLVNKIKQIHQNLEKSYGHH